MSALLVTAAVLAVGVGIAHSTLGERYILVRLLRRENLPRLFGTDLWTKRILRFAWHLTTIAWFGFAAVLVVLASEPESPGGRVGIVIAVTFAFSATVTAASSRLRHPAWVVFLAIAVLAWFGS